MLFRSKGGVGKSTTCENLGVGLAMEGKKVLLVDTDPQGSLTISMGWQQPDELPTTLSTLMQKAMNDQSIPPGEGVLHHAEGVDLIPANIELAGLEVALVNSMNRKKMLKQVLESAKREYDFILLDCILKTIAGCGQLSEMYSIDFNEDICIIGHSGSGDADISEKKPTMKIVPVFHGKTGGGYLTQFYPHLGPVTYLGITQDKDGHFKFVVAEGVNEPGPIFTFGDTNMRTRFTCGAREFCNRWSEAGPTHHMAAATGRHIDTILKVAKIFDVPVGIITR